MLTYHLRERSIDTDALCEFLETLRAGIGRKKAVLLLDNLEVHRTKRAQKLARDLKFEHFSTEHTLPGHGLDDDWGANRRAWLGPGVVRGIVPGAARWGGVQWPFACFTFVPV